MANTALDQIQHIVVLMLENRSFDNLLGWLYDPANQPPFNTLPPANFNGVYGKNLSNPSVNGGTVPVGKGSDPTMPHPDPGEPYEDVYAQVYGQKNVLPLEKVPPVPPTPPNMEGFLYNYTLHAKESDTKPDVIMNCFTPKTVPVLSSLAYYYGVCDHWFASIPTQTLCNRSYLHAGTSSGYVDNEGGNGVLFQNKTPTIFNVLSASSRSWKIYCASWIVTSLALLTQEELWDPSLFDYFWHLQDFCKAAGKPNGLPHYSFIEPIYIDSLVWGAENDMHPEAWPFTVYGDSNVEEGEKLLYTVYQAVRNSPDWNSTMLIVLFDEHGGCYDHVNPPTSATCPFAISPDGVVIPQGQPGGSGFNFDRLGVRVPAIIVSPYTAQQTILNTAHEHTSVLSTIVECFGLPKGKLGKRQAVSPDISDALNLPVSAPRQDHPPIPQPAGWRPAEQAQAPAARDAALRAKGKPLRDLQRQIVQGAARRFAVSTALAAESTQVTNSLEADALLMKLEGEFLARREQA
jgi:phospholipase C